MQRILNILFRCSDLYQVEDVLRLIGSDEEAIPSGSDDDRLDSDDSDLEAGDLNNMFTDGEYGIQSKYADDYCDDNDNDNDYNYEDIDIDYDEDEMLSADDSDKESSVNEEIPDKDQKRKPGSGYMLI